MKNSIICWIQVHIYQKIEYLMMIYQRLWILMMNGYIRRTGIKNRCISIGENTSDLAYEAGLKAIKNAGFTADDIDLIIVSTITPDMQMPSVSCMVQKKLGAVNASAFDVSAACSGFIYAVDIADSMIRSRRLITMLVIGAEVLSKYVDWSDRTLLYCLVMVQGLLFQS